MNLLKHSTQKTRFTLSILLLIIFIDSFAYFILMPVLIRLLDPASGAVFFGGLSAHLRNILFGWMTAALPLAYLLSAPIVGHYSDRFGRKQVFAFCLFLSFLGFFLPVISLVFNSIVLLLIARFISGVASSSQPVAWAAIVDLSASRQKAFYLSLAAFVMTLALMLGPIVGAHFSDPTFCPSCNNKTPFMIAMGLAVLNFLLLWFGLRETAPTITAKPKTSVCKEYGLSFTKAVSTPAIRGILLCFLLYEFAWSLYFQDMPLYLSLLYHTTPTQIAHLSFWSGIWMLFGLIVIYPILIRFVSARRLSVSCLVLLVLSLLLAAIGKTETMQWIAIAPMSVMVGMIYPSLLAMLSDGVTAEEQGWIMGLSASMLALAWMLSAFFMGFLTNAGLSVPFYLAAVAALISIFCLRKP